jgi:hypothetical protein
MPEASVARAPRTALMELGDPPDPLDVPSVIYPIRFRRGELATSRASGCLSIALGHPLAALSNTAGKPDILLQNAPLDIGPM